MTRLPGNGGKSLHSWADALTVTLASFIPRKEKTRSNPDLGKITHPWHFFPLSQAAAASFTYFIIYSHIVPSKSVGVGLVFHKKAVREAEGAEVRGLPPQHPDTQQERAGRGAPGRNTPPHPPGEKPKGSSGVEFPPQAAESSGGVQSRIYTTLPVSPPEHPS